MEIVEVAKELIANLGFPIFKAESEHWVEALNNNTLVLQKLLDRMEETA